MKNNNAFSDMDARQRYEFDAMAEMQSEERQEMQRLFAQERKTTHELYVKEKEVLTQNYENQSKHYKQIIMGLIFTLVVLLGSVICGAVYLFTNFDFGMITYQDIASDNYSNSIIYDGITVNADGSR